ncbi:hypothetical protein QBC34DRAFT_401505 [Podospora aff. communis PSN243]|uniref:Secreted protein n=1 Tax=Podospora aff. communis PSN243 TaxID=3040156 RepID=A0AAV9GT81_9PEZI|nr:hypothetical protein QBC34DRAFT_401505 [Podospora aff. communis PSN243]
MLHAPAGLTWFRFLWSATGRTSLGDSWGETHPFGGLTVPRFSMWAWLAATAALPTPCLMTSTIKVSGMSIALKHDTENKGDRLIGLHVRASSLFKSLAARPRCPTSQISTLKAGKKKYATGERASLGASSMGSSKKSTVLTY